MKVKEHLTNTANKFGYEINKDRLRCLLRSSVSKWRSMVICTAPVRTHRLVILCVPVSICVSMVLAVVVCTRRLKRALRCV